MAWSERDLIVARRIRDAFVARAFRLYQQAKQANDSDHTADGDVRLMTAGLLLADLQRLDVRDVPPPDEPADPTVV